MCVESMGLVLTPDSHAFNVFHYNVCVKRAFVPECLCIWPVLSHCHFRLPIKTCPALARTSAQLAGFSVLAFESQSLLTGRH